VHLIRQSIFLKFLWIGQESPSMHST